MKNFNDEQELIQFVKDNHATVGMRVYDKCGLDGQVIGCNGIIGSIYMPDGDEIRFTIMGYDRNSSERVIKRIRSAI